MKPDIVGASNFVNRMFEACGKYQWAREFLKNALEANASKVEFGVEWQAVDLFGVYRRTIVDDGIGMDREELLRFFSTLGEGAKKIGGVHDNFGVGAKISSLPWNPAGVVVISYRDSKAAMIQIVLNEDTSEYELVEFSIDGGQSCVIDPTQIDWGDDEVNWADAVADWAREHGTCVVLLGSELAPDTILGNPDAQENDIKGLSVYLNTRFWDLSDVDVRVAELRSDKKANWPRGPEDKDNTRRPNNRKIQGARFYIADVEAREGKPLASGSVPVDDDRVRIWWYLWEGERPYIHMYAKRHGYVAVKYRDELFDVTSHKARFRQFGIVESDIQQRLTLVIEPAHYDATNGRWGVHPDQSRNRLLFTGGGGKGAELPLSDWGLDFAEDLPEAVMEAIRAARAGRQGSVEDEDYRRRLQDKFGQRWTTMQRVQRKKSDGASAEDGAVTDEETDVVTPPPGGGRRHRRAQRGKRTVRVVRKKASAGGKNETVTVAAPVDVPRYRLTRAEDFEKDWHIAMWNPNDVEGPTVFINTEAPAIVDAIEHHQALYPPVHAEDVERIVLETFGEVAVCKIAHSQKLTRVIPEEELDKSYRTEEALTVALMGLLAEESLIAQRLGRLGRKKPATKSA